MVASGLSGVTLNALHTLGGGFLVQSGESGGVQDAKTNPTSWTADVEELDMLTEKAESSR